MGEFSKYQSTPTATPSPTTGGGEFAKYQGGYNTEGLGAGLPSDPTVSANPKEMTNPFELEKDNWANAFSQAIDKMQKSSYQGARLEYDKKINEVEKEIAEIDNNPILGPQAREHFKKNKIAKLEEIKNDPRYQEITKNIEEQDQQIADAPVDSDWKNKQEYYLEEEKSTLYNWLKYDLPEDLGGSAGMATAQVATAFGRGIVTRLAGMAAGTAVGTGGWGAPVSAALGVASVGVGLYGLWKMREQETDAEVFEAFESNVNAKIASVEQTLGRPLDENNPQDKLIITEIKNEAHKGLDQVRSQNMNLVLGDALSVVLLSAPWSAAAGKLMSPLAKAAGYNRYTRIASNAAGAFASGATEFMEETSQFAIKDQYMLGRYKDNPSIGSTAKESLNLWKDSLDYFVTGESGEGYENDSDYRNAGRSGGILGFMLGGASYTAKTISDERAYSLTTEDIEQMKPDLIDLAKIDYRAATYARYFSTGKEEFLMEGLRNLATTATDPEHQKSIQEELHEAAKAKKLYDQIDMNLGGLAADQKNKVFASAYTAVSQVDKLRKTNAKIQAEIGSTLGADVATDPLNLRAIELKSKVSAIEEILDEYYSMDNAPSNIRAYERSLENQYKEAVEEYKTYLNDNKIKETDANALYSDKLTALYKNHTNNNTGIASFSNDFNKLKTKEGIKDFLEGKNVTKAVKPMELITATIEEYKDFENRNVGKRRFKSRNEKIKRDNFERNLLARIEAGEDVKEILNEINKDLPAISNVTLSEVDKILEDKKIEAVKDIERIKYLEDEIGTMEQMQEDTTAEVQELEELRAKKSQEFLDEVTLFDTNKSKFKVQETDKTDNEIRREVANEFGKDTEAIKDFFNKDSSYAKVNDVQKQIARLTALRNIMSKREDTISTKEFEGLIDSIDSQIKELSDIEGILEQRVKDRKIKDQLFLENAATSTYNSIGLNRDGTTIPKMKPVLDFIKSVIGEMRFNSIITDAKLNNFTGAYADAIVDIFTNSLDIELQKQFNDIVTEIREDVVTDIESMDFVQKRAVQSAQLADMFSQYIDNPRRVIIPILSVIQDAGANGFDNNKESAVYRFIKEQDIVEFTALTSTQDRGTSRITREEFIKFVELHNLIVAVDSLDRASNSSYRILNEISAERDEQKKNNTSEKPNPAPSNQQLKAIRELVSFFFTNKSNSKFHNMAYLQGYAGTGKTNVVIRWVVNILGVGGAEVYTAGHNQDSANTLSTSLGITQGNTIDQLINDLRTNATVLEGKKLIVLDEVGAISSDQLSELATAHTNSKYGMIKMILMGDPNQVAANGSLFAPIEDAFLIKGSENITAITPLTQRYRSDVNAVVDVQDLFIDQNLDLTKEPLHTKSNTATPTTFKGDLLGVNGTKSFDADIIQILKNRPVDSRSRAIIVGDDKQVAYYTQLLADNAIQNVQVLTYITAQGKTIDEVYVNIPKTKQFDSNNLYNTAIYTAFSRATKYILTANFNATNDVQGSIESNAEKQAKDNKDRAGEFIKERDAEINVLTDLVEDAVAPKGRVLPTTVIEEAVEVEVEGIAETDVVEDGQPEVQDMPIQVTYEVPAVDANAENISLDYPTSTAIAKEGRNPREGVVAGDEVLFIVEENNNGEGRVAIVAPVAGKKNRYRRVAVLSNEELDNPPKGHEALYSKLKTATSTGPFDKLSKAEEGTLKSSEHSGVIEYGTARIAHASTVGYEYGEIARPFNISDVMNRFINSFFPLGNADDPASLKATVRLRIYTTQAEVNKISEESGGEFEPLIGVPYLHIIDPGQTAKNGRLKTKDQFIRSSARKLNKNDVDYVKPVSDTLKKAAALEIALEDFFGMPILLGDELFAKLTRANGLRGIKAVLAEATIPMDDARFASPEWEQIEKLRKSFDDLMYDKETKPFTKKEKEAELARGYYVSHPDLEGEWRIDAVVNGVYTLKQEDKTEHKTEGLTRVPHAKRTPSKAQKALMAIAKANFDVNGVMLRHYNDFKADDAVGKLKKDMVPKMILSEEKAISASNKGIRKYITKYRKWNNIPDSIPYSEFSEEDKAAIQKGVSAPITTQVLRDMLSFDENGDSNINGGFGLRIPLDKKLFTANKLSPEAAGLLEESFERVLPTKIVLEMPAVPQINNKPDVSITTKEEVAEKEGATYAEEEDEFNPDDINSVDLTLDAQENLGIAVGRDQIEGALNRFFPNIKPEQIQILDRAAMIRARGKEVWGFFKEGVIYLMQNPDGSVYTNIARHEAFHKAFREFTDKTERASVVSIARKLYPELRTASMQEVEEFLARKFQVWTGKREHISAVIQRFFNRIANIFGFILNNEVQLEDYFSTLEEGKRQMTTTPYQVGEAVDLIKIDEHYNGDETKYIQARSLVLNKLKALVYPNVDEAVKVSKNGALTNIPYPIGQGVERVREQIKSLEESATKYLNNTPSLTDKQRADTMAQIQIAKILMGKDGKMKPFEELLESIYPDLKGDFMRNALAEMDEDEANDTTGGIYKEHFEDGDLTDHKKNVTQAIRDFLAIFTADGLNAEFAYAILRKGLAGTDAKNLDVMMEQFEANVGNSVNTEFIKTRLNELIERATASTYNRFKLTDNMYFDDPNTFIFKVNDSLITVERGNKYPSDFYKAIRDKANEFGMTISDRVDGVVIQVPIDYNFIRFLNLKMEAANTIREMHLVLASLRERAPYYLEKRGSSNYTYLFNSIKRRGAASAVRTSLEQALFKGYENLDLAYLNKVEAAVSAKKLTDSTNARAELAQEFFDKLGMGVVPIPKTKVRTALSNIKTLLDKVQPLLGDKVPTKKFEEDGVIKETEITINDVVDDLNNVVEELSSFILSASARVPVDSYTRADGKKSFRYMLDSYALSTIRRITDPIFGKVRPEFASTNFYKLNPFISGKFALFGKIDYDSAKVKDSSFAPVQYKEETPADFIGRHINSYSAMILRSNQKEGGIHVPIYPYINSNKPSTVGEFTNLHTQAEIREVLYNALQQEVVRPDADVSGYAKDKTYLPGITSAEMISLRDGKDFDARANKLVDKIMAKLKEDARDLAVQTIKDQHRFDTKLPAVYASIKDYLIEGSEVPQLGDEFQSIDWSTNKPVYVAKLEQILPFVEVVYTNDWINSHFLNQVALGDQAYYSNGLKQTKRVSIAMSIGYKLFVNKLLGMPEKTRVAVADDVIGTLSEAFDKFNQISKRDYEETDGGGFMTPAYADKIRKTGTGRTMKLGDNMKLVYAHKDKNGAPRLIKNAFTVLSDDLIKQFPKLATLREKMEKENLDMMVFKSSFKVGAPSTLTKHNKEGQIDSFDSNSILDLDTEGFRIVLDAGHAVEDSWTANPSQLTYFLNTNRKNMDAAKELYELNAKLMKLGMQDLKDAIGLNEARGKVNEAKFRAKILAGSQTKGSENFHNTVAAKDATGKPYLSLNFPIVINKAISQLSSIFTKNTVKIKFRGTKLVLVPDYGIENKATGQRLKFRNEQGFCEVIMPNIYKSQFTDEQLLESNDLNGMLAFRIPSTGMKSALPIKIVGFYDDKGTNAIIAPAEITLFHGSDYDIDTLYILSKEIAKGTVEINGKTAIKKGEIIGEKDGKTDPSFIAVVEDAINQTKKLLAKASQNKDKVAHKKAQRMIKEYRKLLAATYRNRVVNIFIETMAKSENENTIMSPISKERFKAVNEDGSFVEGSIFHEIERITGREIYGDVDLNNMLHRSRIHASNFSGTSLTGASANHAKAIAYIIESSPNGIAEIDENHHTEIDGTPYNQLRINEVKGVDETGTPTPNIIPVNNFKGNVVESNPSIYDTIDTIINFALDNVNDQATYAMNLTNNTANAFMGMVAQGIPAGTVVKFMLTAGIVEISRSMRTTDGIKEVSAKLNAKYLELGGLDIDKELKDAKITTTSIEALMKPQDISEITELQDVVNQIAIFNAFKSYNAIGEYITENSRFLNKTIKAFPTTVAEMQDAFDSFAKVSIPVNEDNTKVEKNPNIIKNDIMSLPHISTAKEILDVLYKTITNVFQKHDARINTMLDTMLKRRDAVIQLEKGDNKNLSKVKDEFAKYLMSGISYQVGETTYTMDTSNELEYTVTSKKGKEYVVNGTDAWNQRFIDKVQTLIDANPRNEFLRNMEIWTDNMGVKKINYSSANNVDIDQVVKYHKAFMELSDGGVITDIQRDFIKYAAVNFGLSFGSTNYSALLPPMVYSEINTELDNMYDTLLTGTEDQVNTKLKNLEDHFLLQLVINNGNDIKGSFNVVKNEVGDVDVSEEGATRAKWGGKEVLPQGTLYYNFRIDNKANADGVRPGGKTYLAKKGPYSTDVYKKVEFEGSMELDFTYYQKIAKVPHSQAYQFSMDIATSGYSVKEAFNPFIITRRVDDNRPDNNGKKLYRSTGNTKFEVGQKIGLKDKADTAQLNIIDYTVESVSEPVETLDDLGRIITETTYTLANPVPRVVTARTIDIASGASTQVIAQVKQFAKRMALVHKKEVNTDVLVTDWITASNNGVKFSVWQKAAEAKIKNC